MAVTLACMGAIFLPHADAQQYETRKTVSEKVRKWYQKGLEESRSGNPEKALGWFEKCLDAEPLFLDALLSSGSVLYDQSDLAGAEEKFELVASTDTLYLPRVWYTLGIISRRQGDFGEAAGRFEIFLNSEERNENLITKAKKLLRDSRFAEKAIDKAVPFIPVPLGPGVNSPMAEYLPTLPAERNLLIFTRVVDGQEDFYESKLSENGLWEEARPIQSLNSPLNEGAQTLSADGRVLIFTGCNRKDGYGSCDLYITAREGERWKRPQNMGPPLNTASWESQPSLAANGQVVYFSSNRAGGIGGKDIWFSTRQPDGSWGEPENLGQPVNTPDDEQSPFIHADGETLYFESEGHPGMGAHDLFVSRLSEGGEWSNPENLGFPINTTSNEGALFVDVTGRTAYFATDRNVQPGRVALKESAFDNPAKGVGTDLYSFSLHPSVRPVGATYVKARVFSTQSRLPVEGAFVELTDLSRDKEAATIFTDEDGAFLMCLPAGRDYALHVKAPDHLFSSEHFSLTAGHTIDDPYEIRIWLEPIPDATSDKGHLQRPIVLKNVFFETGSAELLPASLKELNTLQNLLETKKDLRIQLRGHTDNIGSEEDNQILSESRAKAVYDYLIEKGIDASRLAFKGFGESQPVDSNEIPEGRQKNRRTEFLVLPK